MLFKQNTVNKLSTIALLENIPNRQALLREYQFAMTETMLSVADNPAVAKQFLPNEAELTISPNELIDPIGDEPHSPLPFLVHRYSNRVLWKIAPTCAVYCRFCFRKEYIGRKGVHPTVKDIQAAHNYLAAHDEVEEVILSGGDPLTLSPERLRPFVEPLRHYCHIKRIRIHSRMPIVSPECVTEALLALLAETGKSLVMVLHINHAAELTTASDAALARLAQNSLLLSQSVLLKGVNDTVEALKGLTDALLARRIHPYYLHHLDLARGTGHFRLTLAEGEQLYRAFRQAASGVALPTYIVELPGGGGKVPVLQLTDNQRAFLRQMGIE